MWRARKADAAQAGPLGSPTFADVTRSSLSRVTQWKAEVTKLAQLRTISSRYAVAVPLNSHISSQPFVCLR